MKFVRIALTFASSEKGKRKATYLSWVVKWKFILQPNEEGKSYDKTSIAQINLTTAKNSQQRLQVQHLLYHSILVILSPFSPTRIIVLVILHRHHNLLVSTIIDEPKMHPFGSRFPDNGEGGKPKGRSLYWKINSMLKSKKQVEVLNTNTGNLHSSNSLTLSCTAMPFFSFIRQGKVAY